MSGDTTGDQRTPEEVAEQDALDAQLEDTQPVVPETAPPITITYGGEPGPGETPVVELDPDKPVVGLKGEPIQTPRGVWYAAVDDHGNVQTDAAGRVVRVHPPSSRPRIPLAQLVAGTLAP